MLGLPLCAFVLALVLGGSAGATVNRAAAGGTLVFAGAADPTYLDPALVSDGESFRVTEQIFEGLVQIRPGTTSIRPRLRPAGRPVATARATRSSSGRA